MCYIPFGGIRIKKLKPPQQKGINHESKRRRKNNSHTIEARQDARTSVQHKRQKLYNRREACKDPRQRMRWLLRPEGPLHVQEYKERSPAAPGITRSPAMGGGHGCTN